MVDPARREERSAQQFQARLSRPLSLSLSLFLGCKERGGGEGTRARVPVSGDSLPDLLTFGFGTDPPEAAKEPLAFCDSLRTDDGILPRLGDGRSVSVGP